MPLRRQEKNCPRFQASQDYKVRPCVKQNQTKQATPYCAFVCCWSVNMNRAGAGRAGTCVRLTRALGKERQADFCELEAGLSYTGTQARDTKGPYKGERWL